MTLELFIGSTVIELEQIGSTNNYARQLVRDKMPIEGTVIVTDEQTEGRGQRQNTWVSEPKKNLCCSYILRPVFLSAKNQFLLSAVTALAVSDVVSLLLLDDKQVKIKWPNDILVDGKKIAGILIENSLRGTQIETSIIGVGLNVNQLLFPKEFNATSLQLLSKRKHTINDVLEMLNQKLSKYYLQLRSGNFDALMVQMNERLFGKIEKQKMKINGSVEQIEVLQVLQSGKLELLHENGIRASYMHHEIERLS